MALQKYTKEWLEELCKESISYNEVLKKAGRKISGGNSSHLKKKISEFNIDISHFKGQSWNKGLTKETDSRIYGGLLLNKEDIFIENSSTSRTTIRKYILKLNLLEYKCEMCGNIGEWRGKTMALELDHINGVNNDHRLSNLRWLCPNCHSTTETYAGKNNNNNS